MSTFDYYETLTSIYKLDADKPNPWNTVIFQDNRKIDRKTDGSIKKHHGSFYG